MDVWPKVGCQSRNGRARTEGKRREGIRAECDRVERHDQVAGRTRIVQTSFARARAFSCVSLFGQYECDNDEDHGNFNGPPLYSATRSAAERSSRLHIIMSNEKVNFLSGYQRPPISVINRKTHDKPSIKTIASYNI